MGRTKTERASWEAIHRFTMGASTAYMDARSLHLATADYANPVSFAGNGIAAIICQWHCLSQYWVGFFLHYFDIN